MEIAEIENLLVAALEEPLRQYELIVIVCPNDLIDLARPTRNRVVVQFKRVSYERPNQNNISALIQQIGYLRYEIIIQFRGLRTHLGCLGIAEAVYTAITGIRPDPNLPFFFYQSDGSFIDFIDGFWIYRSVFEVQIIAITPPK